MTDRVVHAGDLDGTRGLAEDGTKAYVKVDGTTVSFDGSGQLKATAIAAASANLLGRQIATITINGVVTSINETITKIKSGTFNKTTGALTLVYTGEDGLDASTTIDLSDPLIVYVNSDSPLTATIFSNESPPTVNDPTLQTNNDFVYVGTDGSSWYWNGTTYISKPFPSIVDTSATARGLVNLVSLQQLGAGDKLINSVRIGTGAGDVGTNTTVGRDALGSNTTGAVNTAVGQQALYLNTTGSNNNAFGQTALRSNTTGIQNVAFGTAALFSNTTGSQNMAIGQASLYQNTIGAANTAVGAYGLFRNTTGSRNLALGNSALSYSTTGNDNSAYGNNALYYQTVADGNTAIGSFSLFTTTTGYSNTAVGMNTLRQNTTGYFNVAVGRDALRYATTAVDNVAIGKDALLNTTTGGTNTAIGNGAMSSNTTFTNSSALGFLTQVTGSNQVQIGNSSTTTYVYGTVQNRSDLRDKADVRDTLLGLAFINALRPVDFKYDMREDYKQPQPVLVSKGGTPSEEELQAYQKACEAWVAANKLANITHDGTRKRNRYHHGVIAQELLAMAGKFGVDFGGIQNHLASGGEDVLSVGYDEFVAPLIKAVQELSAQLTTLQASTEWWVAGTTDAASSKTANIARTGWATVGKNSVPGAPLDVFSTGTATYSVLARFTNPDNRIVGNNTQLVFGAAQETGNAADWRFYYAGNNAATNRIDLGFSGYATPAISYLVNGKVGIRQAAPHSHLTVNGSFATPIRQVTASTAFTDSDFTMVIGVSGTSGTLPSAVGTDGRICVVKNSSAGPVTIVGMIESSTSVSLTIPAKGSRIFQASGGQWLIIGAYL